MPSFKTQQIFDILYEIQFLFLTIKKKSRNIEWFLLTLCRDHWSMMFTFPDRCHYFRRNDYKIILSRLRSALVSVLTDIFKNYLFLIFIILQKILGQNIDIKQKSQIISVLLLLCLAVPSVCLSDNIPPPLAKCWKGREFFNIHHVIARKDTAEITGHIL